MSRSPMGRPIASRRMAGMAACAGVLAMLAACSSPINVVSADSQVVTIRHTDDARQAADDYAERNCRQYNKVAHWRSSHPESTATTFSIYDCVPM